MNRSVLKRLPVVTAWALIAAAVLAGPASAGIITIGSPLTANFESEKITKPLTLAQPKLPGATLTSPVDGAVVRWRLAEASGGPFYLRILRPQGGGIFLGAGKSAPQTPAGKGVEVFPTNLPIKVGDAIGFDNAHAGEEADSIGLVETPGGEIVDWSPFLPEGASVATSANEKEVELAYNADVQPAPKVTALSATSGYFKGGTPVTITGTDFEGASAVSIGGVAVPFTLVSETQITVATPPTALGVPVSVAVTTNAGTAPAPIAYTGVACVVPSVKGKTLKAAKKKVLAGGCKVGKLKKLRRATAKTGRVTKVGGGKPGAQLPPGSALPLTIVPPPSHHKHR